MTSISGLPGQSSVSSVLSQNGGSFGENPFLLLLTEQLRNQTPLEPVDNESFMNQMASYSSMQQQQDLNANMLALLDYQGLLARMQGLSQGSALLGKEVSYTDANGRDVTDLVDSVYVDDDGDVMLRLHDGDEVSLRDVHSIGMADDGGAADTGASSGDPTDA